MDTLPLHIPIFRLANRMNRMNSTSRLNMPQLRLGDYQASQGSIDKIGDKLATIPRPALCTIHAVLTREDMITKRA